MDSARALDDRHRVLALEEANLLLPVVRTYAARINRRSALRRRLENEMLVLEVISDVSVQTGSDFQEFVDKNTVRTETDLKVPVVRPPAGGDAYLIARLWAWWPMLELEEGKTYRLHLSSMDFLHGFSLQPENINIEVHPGYEHIITVTPTKAGTYSIICNEYCGINHHTMASRLYVVKQ